MVPKLQIYAGDPDPLQSGPVTVHFRNIHRICYLDDPAMPGPVNRHWAVSDDFGVQLVSLRGEIQPWLGAATRQSGAGRVPWVPGAFHCEGLASRPPNSLPGNPHHLVFSESPADPRMGRASQVYALAPDGSRRLLAGAHDFGGIADLALDREGNVFVLDRGNRQVFRISPSGEAAPVAGDAFVQPMGMALDALTGDLYVSDFDAIHRIRPDGEVRRVLGAGEAHGTLGALEPRPHDPAPRVPSDAVNGLHRAGGLTVKGRNLFIADTGACAVRVLDLDTGTLHTLAGSPAEIRTRRGPIAYYSPGRAPEECAALAFPSCVAFSTDGICLVGTGSCIAELDMPPFESPARAALRRKPEERRNGHPVPRPAQGRTTP